MLEGLPCENYLSGSACVKGSPWQDSTLDVLYKTGTPDVVGISISSVIMTSYFTQLGFLEVLVSLM